MENTKTKRLSTKSMVLCAMFTALVAVGAFIQIPVPYMDYFTLQFFFVLLAGLILGGNKGAISVGCYVCLLYTSPSPRDRQKSRMPSSA